MEEQQAAATAQQQTPTKRTMPQSELDFHMLTTNALWGDPNANPELKERLNKYFLKRDETGQPLFNKAGDVIGSTASLWSLLGFFTRDMRLANLAVWNGEFAYCQYYIDLASDLLQAEMLDSFVVSLSKAASVLELSQSKGGFLRKIMNTLRHESLSGEIEPPKKQLFGKNPGGKEGY